MRGPTNALAMALIVAGLVGYLRAKSKMSLLFGMGAGFALMFAGTMMADVGVKVSGKEDITRKAGAHMRSRTHGVHANACASQPRSKGSELTHMTCTDPRCRPQVGPLTALVVVAGLGYKMYVRYTQTKAVMPAGALAGVCGVYALGYLVTLFA